MSTLEMNPGCGLSLILKWRQFWEKGRGVDLECGLQISKPSEEGVSSQKIPNFWAGSIEVRRTVKAYVSGDPETRMQVSEAILLHASLQYCYYYELLFDITPTNIASHQEVDSANGQQLSRS